MRVFRWKKAPGSEELAPHELRLDEQPDGKIKLLLLIRKKTPLTLVLTIEGDAASFEDAWNRQSLNGEGAWKQIALYEEGTHFFCIRSFAYRNRWVVWRVEHIDGIAYDVFDMYDGQYSYMVNFYSRH